MDDANPIIERLRREHMTQVIDLLQHISAYKPPMHLHEEIWRAFVTQSHVYSVVATANATVIGYGSIVIEKKIRGGIIGHIEDIIISSTQRNKGIGKLIVDELYELAKKNHCYKVALQCKPHNVEFYKKCDYESSGFAMQRFIP